MKLRTSLLAGLLLSVLTIGFTFGTVLLRFPRILAFLAIVILGYGFAAVRRTQPTKAADILVLHHGLNWGLAIGGSFAAAIALSLLPAKEFVFPAILLSLALPFASGSAGAIKTGSIRIGTRMGFWGGMIGSLLGFVLVAATAYLQAWISGKGVFAYMNAHEFGPMVLATYILFIYGPVFSPLAATVGGWVGIRLERTGRISPLTVER
jgi:hypothetical protein